MQSFLQYRRSERKLRQQIGQYDIRSKDHEKILPTSTPPPNDRHYRQKDIGEDDSDLIIVNFESEDELNPQNWSLERRTRATLLVLGAGVVGGWASANDWTIINQAKASFGVSEVAKSLSIGLYLVAFGVGSLLARPFSETTGRNPIYIVTLAFFMIFIMASGLAPNIGAQLCFRFLAGLFGCTAVTTCAGSVADLW